MPISNRQISKLLRLAAALLEVHDENHFKILSYEKAAQHIRTYPEPLIEMSEAEIKAIEGIGPTISKKVFQLLEAGSFDELDALIEQTPPGVAEMMHIKGLGGKKVRAIWKELGIVTPEELLEACEKGKIASLKGFGKKTQENIIEILEFYYDSKGKFMYSDAEYEAESLVKYLNSHEAVKKAILTGDIRRKVEVISQIDVLVELKKNKDFQDLPDEKELHLIYEEKSYKSVLMEIPVVFHMADQSDWVEQLILTTGNKAHLKKLDKKLLAGAESEKKAYELNGFPYIIPEMREGLDEFEAMKHIKEKDIIEYKDIKGCLHNHSTWSDGSNSILEMAEKCKSLGLEYFGIADHSQAAFYANGLKPAAVRSQWKEIDKINKNFKEFRIFKGTESDILNNGDLDYDDELLNGFDYVVASVHSKLKMGKEEATARLIRAVENPYITILGHMTARLLLMRKGFEVDFKKVIDACAANEVVIEINANPLRLDMDWRPAYYAIEKNVMLSINPDGHDVKEIENMYYGVCIARKAGLTKERVLNTMSLAEIESYFLKKKNTRP